MKFVSDRRLLISVVCLAFAAHTFSVNAQIPTDFARNTFFYADYFVADQIVSHGSIPTAGSINVPSYWGKINSKLQLPLQPMLLALLKIVALIPYSTSFTFFPSWLLLAAAFYILLRGMGVPLSVRTLISTAAGLAVPATPRYPIEMYAVVTGIMLIGISVVYIHIDSHNHTNHRVVNGSSTFTILILLLLFCFYWDPEKFFILSGVIGLAGAIKYLRGGYMLMYISIITVSVTILLQVFGLPPYIAQFQSVVLSIASLDFSNPIAAYTSSSPSSGSGTSSFRGYYSLIPLTVVLPLAILGGIYTLLDLRDRSPDASIVAISWGAVAFLLSVVFMIASEGWLAGRSFTFAQPVLFIGCARYLKDKNVNLSQFVSIAILILVIISLVLQLGTPLIRLHTYEPGIQQGTQWASDHSSGTIYTDHKLGAPLAATGDFRAEYPKDNPNLTRAIYYPDNYSHFSRAVDRPVLITEGMKDYGVRAAGSRGPIPERVFNSIIEDSNKVYSNGETYYTSPK